MTDLRSSGDIVRTTIRALLLRLPAGIEPMTFGDACDRCRGKGEIPKVPGSYDVWIRCPKCKGSGGRRPSR